MDGARRESGAARRRGLTLGLALVLILGVVLIYARATDAEFVNYDDDRYVTANDVVREGLTREGLRWALTSTSQASNWHPVTWLSHMADVEWFGLEPAGHHATSVAIHALAAALLLFAMVRLTGRVPESFFVAALFAWHPLRVESVAWVAERKDVLAGLFAFLTIYLYAGWVRRGGVLRYLGVVTACALGLASKSMLVTLPFVLLLLDTWPLERDASLGRRVLEKLPLFALSAATAIVALASQSESGATGLIAELPLGLRLVNALAGLATYVGQLGWPGELACLYPHAATFAPDPLGELVVPAMIGTAALLGLGYAGFALRERHGYLLTGWLWTVGMLVPVSGLVQVGYQAHADRYTYLPLVGLGIALVFGVAELCRGKRVAAGALGAAWLFALAFVASRQVSVWRDSLTLWRRCIEMTEPNFVAQNNVGNLLARANDLDGALSHFEASVRIFPGSAPDAASAVRYSNLAGAYTGLGRGADALRALETAVELDGGSATLRTLLGRALSDEGRDVEALVHLRRALTLRPGDMRAAEELARILATSRTSTARDGAEALALAKQLCTATRFEAAELVALLAAAHAETGDFAKAIEWQERVIPAVEPFLRPEMRRRLNGYQRERAWRKSP